MVWKFLSAELWIEEFSIGEEENEEAFLEDEKCLVDKEGSEEDLKSGEKCSSREEQSQKKRR